MRTGKANVSEPLMTCRKRKEVTETRLPLLACDKAREVPAYGPSGDRHEGGAYPFSQWARTGGAPGAHTKALTS